MRWVGARAAAAGVLLAVVAAAMDRLGPFAGQISQGIRQRMGSLSEYSARVDIYTCISTVSI